MSTPSPTCYAKRLPQAQPKAHEVLKSKSAANLRQPKFPGVAKRESLPTHGIELKKNNWFGLADFCLGILG